MAINTRFWHRATIALVAIAGGAAAMAIFVQDGKAPEPKLAVREDLPPAASRPPAISIPPAALTAPAVSAQPADSNRSAANSAASQSHAPVQASTAKTEDPVQAAEGTSPKPGNQTISAVEPRPAPPGSPSSASPATPALPPVQGLENERPPPSNANPSATAMNKLNGSTDRSALSSDQAGSPPPSSAEAPARKSKQARRITAKKVRPRPAPFPLREFFAFRP